MSDELRNRIAEVMWDAKCADGMRAAVRPDCTAMAQAIIDDLGLTVETRIDVPGKRGINPVSRVVGRWER